MKRLTRELGTRCPVVPPSPEQLSQLLSLFDKPLPASYLAFLHDYNGGMFVECYLAESEIAPALMPERFFSVDFGDGVLAEINHNLRDFKPIDYLAIAEDPGGDCFFLDVTTGRVLFCPQLEEVLDVSSHVFTNFIVVSESFEHFIDALQPFPENLT
jgi:hypothetical protein